MQRPADIVDCDIHPAVRSMADLEPWLDRQWIDHYRTYGALRQTHYVTGAPYHKSQPNASRRDAYPPEGGPQGSSPGFLATQHLDTLTLFFKIEIHIELEFLRLGNRRVSR